MIQAGWELGVLGVALAIDAVAVTSALAVAGARKRTLAIACGTFGFAQGALCGLGAVGGTWLVGWAADVVPWVAFGLLALVGGRMVAAGDDDTGDLPADPSAVVLAGLAVATNIDALAAGVSVPLLGLPLAVSIPVVGALGGGLTALAAAAGRRASALAGPWALRVAGVLLVAIGARMLVWHLAGWG